MIGLLQRVTHASVTVEKQRVAEIGQGIPLHVIGDCKLPRNTTAAVHEGHAVGLAL